MHLEIICYFPPRPPIIIPLIVINDLLQKKLSVDKLNNILII